MSKKFGVALGVSLLGGLVVGVGVPAQVFAQAALTVSDSPKAVETYWTPARLANAKPMPLPRPAPGVSAAATAESAPTGPVASGAGSPGARVISASSTPEFVPSATAAADVGVVPDLFGNILGQHHPFTSSRQVALSILPAAMLQYPYRISGKLFFHVPPDRAIVSGDYVCSATIQRHRIITTAGHCVHDGKFGFFQLWRFSPGFRDGVSPFQIWTPTQVLTTTTWRTGGGVVPNAADYAVLEMADHRPSPCGIVVVRLGACLGFAGFLTGPFLNEHITAVGYPCNLDSCLKQHRTDAQPFLISGVPGLNPNNTEQIGSDMGGGASGGGWFQNFGQYAVGEPGVGLNTAPNTLRSVTSWGFTAPQPMILGGSVLDSRYFGAGGILTIICAHKVGNCN